MLKNPLSLRPLKTVQQTAVSGQIVEKLVVPRLLKRA
jgi:hypothetical protein